MPFTPTWINWYNDVDGAKVACISGQYENIPYGSVSDRAFYADGKPPHPEHGQFQRGLACSKTSRTIVIDVDKPEAWVEGNTYVTAGDWPDIATSYREDGARAHIVVIVPENLLELWPKQGPTVWGDVKSNGFSYHEGVHYSGMCYVATQNPWLEADAELLRSLTADRIFPQGKSGLTGTMVGPWLDDTYRIGSHDECVATVYSMSQAGMSGEDIVARLELIMPNREGDWPERAAYIHEKITSAERKIEQRERAEQDWWGGFHEGGYASLVAELNRRTLEQAALATPKNTAADAVEWIEHQVSEGLNLKNTPLCLRLNPQMRPIEPRSANDKANASDILEAGMPVIRFASDEGCWLQNTGTHWETFGTKSEKQEIGRTLASSYGTFLKSDDDLAAELAAKGAAESETEIEIDKARAERLIKARTKYNNSGGQSQIAVSLITEARASDRYSVNIADLDTEADVLWAGGYPWSLRHEALTVATWGVNQVHMKTARCAPYPGPTPAFDQVLEAVWPDPDVRAWALREIAGVALWGKTSKKHPVLDGPPHSGKSTLAEIIVDALGAYAVQVSPDKILGGDVSSAHEEEVASMIGARLVWMDEPPPGGKQSISRFNDLASGTGKLSAARKYQNKVSAPKLFNFLICQNSRNALRMDVQGVGERMTFIPCDGEAETTGAAWRRWKLEGEREYAGVLALLIRECALFHRPRCVPVCPPECTGHALDQPLAAQLGRASAQERADEFATWLADTYKLLPWETLTTDQRLASSPTVGLLRTQYNDGHARANALPRIGSAEVVDQLNRIPVKIATAGSGNDRKKNVVFVTPKAVSFSSGY